MPDLSKVLINGISYSWCNMSTTLLGVTLAGITRIDFDEGKTVEKLYGAGCTPVAYGSGQYEANASMELYREETEALKDAAPGRQVLDLPVFDIMIRWEPTNGIERVVVLKNIKIVKVNYSHETQATHFIDQYELVVSHVLHKR